jgi:hypothetical protein
MNFSPIKTIYVCYCIFLVLLFLRRENPSTEDQHNRLLTLSLNTKLTFALFGVLPYSEWPVEHPHPPRQRKQQVEEAIKSQNGALFN